MPWAWITAPTPSTPTDTPEGGVRVETPGSIRSLLSGAGFHLIRLSGAPLCDVLLPLIVSIATKD